MSAFAAARDAARVAPTVVALRSMATACRGGRARAALEPARAALGRRTRGDHRDRARASPTSCCTSRPSGSSSSRGRSPDSSYARCARRALRAGPGGRRGRAESRGAEMTRAAGRYPREHARPRTERGGRGAAAAAARCRRRAGRRCVSEGDRTAAPLTDDRRLGVFVGAVRDALVGRRRRPGRALAEGPSDRPRRQVLLAAVPPARGPARRPGRRDGLTLGELPDRLDRRHRLAPTRGSARALGLGVVASSASAATSTPDRARSRRERSTRCCSQGPGSSGSAGSTRSRRRSTRSRCCRRPARARSPWRSRLGSTALADDIACRHWTTPTAGRR